MTTLRTREEGSMPKQYTKEEFNKNEEVYCKECACTPPKHLSFCSKKESLREEWREYTVKRGDIEMSRREIIIADWWLEKFSSLKQELLLEIGEDRDIKEVVNKELEGIKREKRKRKERRKRGRERQIK